MRLVRHVTHTTLNILVNVGCCIYECLCVVSDLMGDYFYKEKTKKKKKLSGTTVGKMGGGEGGESGLEKRDKKKIKIICT